MAAEKNQNTLYLVTGAAGFLGGTVCRQLVDQGHKVRAFILPNDPARKFVPEEVSEQAVCVHRDHQPRGHHEPAQGHGAFHERHPRRV